MRSAGQTKDRDRSRRALDLRTSRGPSQRLRNICSDRNEDCFVRVFRQPSDGCKRIRKDALIRLAVHCADHPILASAEQSFSPTRSTLGIWLVKHDRAACATEAKKS